MRRVIHSKNAPSPIGVYNQAIEAGEYIFISGQIALNLSSSELINDSIESEVDTIMKNINAILQEAGCTFNNVIKTTIFLVDMEDYDYLNDVYSWYFKESRPARSTVQVAALPKGARVQIECVAYKEQEKEE